MSECPNKAAIPEVCDGKPLICRSCCELAQGVANNDRAERLRLKGILKEANSRAWSVMALSDFGKFREWLKEQVDSMEVSLKDALAKMDKSNETRPRAQSEGACVVCGKRDAPLDFKDVCQACE